MNSSAEPSDAAAMSAELVPAAPVDLIAIAAEMAMLDAVAQDLDEQALAASTRRYYKADFMQYERWCARFGLRALPCDPQTVRLYLTDLSLQRDTDGLPRYRASTIERHLASLSRYNYDHGYGRGLAREPRVARLLQAIKNSRQEKTGRKRPLLTQDLRRIITGMEHHRWPAGVTAARDTLALGLAYATAMRREEVTGLCASQVRLEPLDGIWVHLGRSKTDQAGHGVVLPVPYGEHTVTCVPCAWVRWLRLLAVRDDRAAMMRLVRETPGDPQAWQHICRGAVPDVDQAAPLLRSMAKGGQIGSKALTPGGFNHALKRRLVAAGYDPRPYSAHSLRAGMVTQARRSGASARAVRRQTRHTSDAMVDVYDREWNPLRGDHGVRYLGL